MISAIRLSARLSAILMLLVMVACSSHPVVRTEEEFARVPAGETLYVVPFLTVMVPQAVREEIFDRFVDVLSEKGVTSRYDVVILKQELERIEPEWLENHYVVVGELFAYVEESGCCNTTIRSRSRIRLFQPGQKEAVMVMEYPREIFFDHDYSTIDKQRRLLARDIAEQLADYLMKTLSAA